MSITVNYKGQDIAQSAGDALTLLTAGKYMEADVLLSASGGGGIPYLPQGAELVAENELVLNLSADTSFDSVTPTSSSQIIRAASAADGFISIENQDLDKYEFIFVGGTFCKYAYLSEPTGAKPLASSYGCQLIIGTVDDGRMFDDYHSRTSRTGGMVLTNLQYINGGGGYSFYNTSGYGIQCYAFSVTNAGYNPAVIRVGVPQVIIREHGTYSPHDALTRIDSGNTNIIVKGKLYRVAREKGIINTIQQISLI